MYEIWSMPVLPELKGRERETVYQFTRTYGIYDFVDLASNPEASGNPKFPKNKCYKGLIKAFLQKLTSLHSEPNEAFE